MMLAYRAPLLAQTPAPAAPAPEITVTAPRGLTIGGIAPLLELSPSELESYGVDTLSDLVDALKLLTRSSRSDATPVVLINGHLAGLVEFANLPSDAVERVELLPENGSPAIRVLGESACSQYRAARSLSRRADARFLGERRD